MKPTDKQKEFIRELRKVLDENLKHWETTNDISSPSHYTLIDESLHDIINASLIEEAKIQEILLSIEYLYYCVKKIKS